MDTNFSAYAVVRSGIYENSGPKLYGTGLTWTANNNSNTERTKLIKNKNGGEAQ